MRPADFWTRRWGPRALFGWRLAVCGIRDRGSEPLLASDMRLVRAASERRHRLAQPRIRAWWPSEASLYRAAHLERRRAVAAYATPRGRMCIERASQASARARGVQAGCKSAANPPKTEDLSQIEPVSPIQESPGNELVCFTATGVFPVADFGRADRRSQRHRGRFARRVDRAEAAGRVRGGDACGPEWLCRVRADLPSGERPRRPLGELVGGRSINGPHGASAHAVARACRLV